VESTAGQIRRGSAEITEIGESGHADRDLHSSSCAPKRSVISPRSSGGQNSEGIERLAHDRRGEQEGDALHFAAALGAGGGSTSSSRRRSV
jgi:hypothetical protein